MDFVIKDNALTGYRTALLDLEKIVVSAQKILKDDESTSPAGWQRSAFEYVLNEIRGKLNELKDEE